MTPHIDEELSYPLPAFELSRPAVARDPKPDPPARDPKPDPPTAVPPQLSQINLNAAGIDIGATEHYVAVPADRDIQPVRTFGAFTGDLYELANWLTQCRIRTVVMESTGVFWVPLMEVLEEQGFEVLLVDPRRLKQVPGRKTDVLDCQWLQNLHTFGLLVGAFRPTDQICVLRGFLRERGMLVRYASHHIQHIQKALTQMNILLQQVVSDITGKTGMLILRAIVAGERDPEKLASLRDVRCKNDEETIAKALEGHWRREHLFALKQAVELYDFHCRQIAECDEEIEVILMEFEDRSEGRKLPKHKNKNKGKVDGLAFDARDYLHKMTGVDLTTVDGIGTNTVLTVIGEIGFDMTCWETDKHFSSWLGLCPGNNVTGGRRRRVRTKRCANRAATALRLAANSLHRSRSALGAFLRRKKAQLGAPKAITATAHKLARIIYAMLRYGTDYVDQGQDYYETQYRQRAVASLRRNAKHLGYELKELIPAVEVAT